MEQHQAVQIGEWLVDPDALTLTKGDKQVSLRLKAMTLLLALAKAPGDVRKRDDLISEVWPETAATDDTLNSTIAQLRKILVADEQVPQYIVTVPKKGYRLVAPVRQIQMPRAPIQEHDAENTSGTYSAGLNSSEIRQAHKKTGRPALWAGGLLITAVAVITTIVLLLGPKGAERSRFESAAPHYRAELIAAEYSAEVYPSLSSDASEVLFIRADLDSALGKVVIKNLVTDEERSFHDAPGPYANPVRSQDDKQVAYFAFEGFACVIKLVGSQGGPTRDISSCAGTLMGTGRTALAWMPSGQSIVVPKHLPENGKTALFMVSLDGAPDVQLTVPDGASIGDANPAISPDGRRLAFTRTSDTGSDQIAWVDLSSGKETRLTNELAMVRSVDWFDHNTLVLTSNIGGRFESWTLNIDSSELEWSGMGGPNIMHLNYNEREDAFVVAEMQIDNNVFIRSLDENNVMLDQAKVATTKNEKLALLSHDASKLAFVQESGGRSELWLATIDISDPSDSVHSNKQKLLSLTDSFINRVAWSYDDNRLLVEVLEKGLVSTYVYELSGAQFYRLDTPIAESTHSPIWDDTSTAIYYAVKTVSSWEIWHYSLLDQHARLISNKGGAKLAFDSSNKRLIFSRFSDFGFWSLDLLDENAQPLKLLTASGQMFKEWQYLNGDFYFLPLTELITQKIHKQSEADDSSIVFFESSNLINQFYFDGVSLATSETESGSADIYLYKKY